MEVGLHWDHKKTFNMLGTGSTLLYTGVLISPWHNLLPDVVGWNR